jgi:excisionase family DNA binding protein
MTVMSSVGSFKLLLTPEEAASALGVSRTFLYSLLARQRLFSVKVGGMRRIPLRSLENYVEELCEQQKAS